MKFQNAIMTISILIIALSISFYFVISKPQIEKQRLEQEKIFEESKINMQKEISDTKAEFENIKDSENLLNQFRQECTIEKERANKRVEDLANSCQTEECFKNVANGSLKSITPGADYISLCIQRKQKELSQ